MYIERKQAGHGKPQQKEVKCVFSGSTMGKGGEWDRARSQQNLEKHGDKSWPDFYKATSKPKVLTKTQLRDKKINSSLSKFISIHHVNETLSTFVEAKKLEKMGNQERVDLFTSLKENFICYLGYKHPETKLKKSHMKPRKYQDQQSFSKLPHQNVTREPNYYAQQQAMLRQQVGTYGTSGYQNKQVSQPYASYGASNIQGPIPIASTGVSNIVDMGNKVSMKAIPNQRIVQQVPTTGASKIN